jgi:hypothetical protein
VVTHSTTSVQLSSAGGVVLPMWTAPSSTGAPGPEDAEQALEVLWKVVAGRFGNQAEAA